MWKGPRPLPRSASPVFAIGDAVVRNATALIAVCYGIWLVTREKPAAHQEATAPAVAGKR